MRGRKDSALLHARTRGFSHRLSVARGIVLDALNACPSWYISLSGGKDSICVLSLVRDVAPDTPAQHSARQWALPETTAYLTRTPHLRYVAYLGFDGTNWAKSWESQEQAEAMYSGIKWLEENSEITTRGAPERGVFLGLRCDEAGYRKLNLRTLGPLYDCKKTGKWHCNPISEWSTMDVWAYIYSCGIDYNAAYDRLEELGIEIDRQRIGPLAVESVIGYGQMVMLKRGWPELWNRYANAHPEARQYA